MVQASNASVQSLRKARAPSTPMYTRCSGQPRNVDMSHAKSGAAISSSTSPVARKWPQPRLTISTFCADMARAVSRRRRAMETPPAGVSIARLLRDTARAMSAQNVAIVRRGWGHFLATGEVLEEIAAPDFAWDMSTFRGWPEQRVYIGVDGARAFLRDWTDAFDAWTIELQATHDAGERVVSVCRQRGRSKATGMPVEMVFGMV